MPKISFVIPCFNAASKIENCLHSLDQLKSKLHEIEVIFVDDFSTDNTVKIVRHWMMDKTWAHLFMLEENSGSPSKPRNLGIKKAKGDYIFFLDPDDEIAVPGVLSQLHRAYEANADVVRSPLLRDDGFQKLVMNKITDWEAGAPKSEKVKKLFAEQSTTVCGLVKRQLLIQHQIEWVEDLRLGEDTVFWSEVYSAAKTIEYVDEVDFVYRVQPVQGHASSTQQYENRELKNHLRAWILASQNLAQLGLDYFQIRGQVALQTVLQSMIRFNRDGIGESEFEDFSQFLIQRESIVLSFNLNSRLSELVSLLLDNRYLEFNEGIKPRLVIAGYDLKFIKGAIPLLQEQFQISLDEWTGHDSHDIAKSERLLAWAEVIHCEWLLGNAVWYSHRKSEHQKLIIRTHLFEINRDFGEKINVNNVDRFIAVSTPTQEDIQRRFGFPREKIRMLPNYIDTSAYAKSEDSQKPFNLAIVGILPSRKGFHRALEILRSLRQLDPRYNLSVYGKLPSELPWVANDPHEREYYEECDHFIQQNSLEDAINYPGWSDMKSALADKGFLLSVSDFESFHVAPAEAFAAGNISYFLPWRGVEYIYPSRYIKNSVDEIRDAIYENRYLDSFANESVEGSDFVRETYDIVRFSRDYIEMISSI